MRHWTPNQKLTKEQIATIKHLKANGFNISLISKVLKENYGVSISTAYYHLSENRDAYDTQAKKEKKAQMLKTKQIIYGMIEKGLTTQDVAEDWHMPLATINKIYTS